MKLTLVMVIALLLAATARPVPAAVLAQSKTLRVDSPANNPQLSVENARALYLFGAGDGRALLYVEKQNGQGLAIFDVTTPGEIRRLADATLAQASPFDFVEAAGNNAVLICFRSGSGYALLNLTHAQHPVVEAGTAIAQAAGFQPLGETGALLRVSATPDETAHAAHTYEVVDTTTGGKPHLLAMVADVTGQAANGATGTVFLLNRSGVTVVRRLRVEQERAAELVREEGN